MNIGLFFDEFWEEIKRIFGTRRIRRQPKSNLGRMSALGNTSEWRSGGLFFFDREREITDLKSKRFTSPF
jgi:hypothetical protein